MECLKPEERGLLNSRVLLSVVIHTTGVFFKFGVEVGVELSIVHTGYGSRISCSNLTLLHEWCDLNRLSNAYSDAKFKKNTLYS
jgi:hypothetical protein